MPYLTPRCNSIARILLERERPITIEELTRELHVSARTVRYDLDILEDWLEEKGVRLVRKSRVGVYLDTGSSGYAELSSHFERSGDSQRVYSGPERHQILTRELLGGAPRTLGELAALTNVSKTTAFRDLEAVEGWLKERRIVLVKGHGMSASGSELDIRKALADVVYEEHGSRTLLRLAHARPKEQGGAWLEGRRQIAAPILAGTVWRLQRELGMSFTDESAVELFVHLGVGLVRADQRHYVSIPEQNMEHLQATEEYAAVKRTLTALAERLGIELPTEELCYFTMHVLGAGVSHLYRSGGTGTHGEEYFRTAVADFTAEISSRLGVDLSEDTELQEDLMVELRPWVSRAQFQV
ncbi:MAG TPA: HTH domain-containing protein, partial [Pseudoflavonifractor sp.]|nr:HTH domain-containing protein [Pseudoflavonifractor sp.]